MNAALRRESVRCYGDGPVVVAMIAVRVMQMTADDVIGVVAMWHGGVTAVDGVFVTSGLFVRAVAGRALIRIRCVDRDSVFVGVRTVVMMQMTAVKVISVTVMRDGEMAAIRAVLVRVSLGVLGVRGAATSNEREWHDKNEDFFHG